MFEADIGPLSCRKNLQADIWQKSFADALIPLITEHGLRRLT